MRVLVGRLGVGEKAAPVREGDGGWGDGWRGRTVKTVIQIIYSLQHVTVKTNFGYSILVCVVVCDWTFYLYV